MNLRVFYLYKTVGFGWLPKNSCMDHLCYRECSQPLGFMY